MSAFAAKGRSLLLLLPVALAACGAGGATSSATRTPSRTAAQAGAGTAAGAGVRLKQIATFDQPVYVTGPAGDPHRVFVLQRTGQVMLLVDGHRQRRPFLNLAGRVYWQGLQEQGLLGIAFAPDYASSGVFYVDYTVVGNDVTVVQYRRSAHDSNLADAASARTVLTIAHRYPNHNGGQLAFGPEGDLYIGVGDGGNENDPENNSQNTDTLLGKILRIHPSAHGGYTVPAGNPFVGQPGKRPEIWAYGLRNPWRFSFDSANNDMIIGDVGQDQQEEIDFVPAGSGAGANYGWSIFEGDRRNKPGNAPHALAPVLTLAHSDGYCALIGGYVVRDRSLPSLYGRYLFGDNCRPQIESVTLARGSARGLSATGLQVTSTSSFGQDGAGRIYVASLAGPVYRIVAAR